VSLLRLASARYLFQHPTQLLLSVLGVTLGVAAVLSIDLALQSAQDGFRISAETVSGRATHALVSDAGSIEDTYVARLRIDFDQVEAAPVIEGFATSARVPGRALRILGVDPFSETPFRPFVATGASDLDLSAFLTTRRSVVLSGAIASRAGVSIGDSLPVLVEGEVWMLPIVGIESPDDDFMRMGLSDVLLMDVSGAQEVLRSSGRLTRVDLRIEDTAEGATTLAAISDALPQNVRIEAVGTRSETMSGMIAAFDVNLTALSLLALIFGVFLIYNAVSFSVVQRGALIGRLRAIGVTRDEILRMIVTEALVIGVAGAALGVGVGIILASGLVGLVARTINDLYFAVSVESVQIQPVLLLKAILLGLGATLVAALPPALEAAGQRPRLAMLRSTVEERARRSVPKGALLGAGFSAVGGLLLLVPTKSLAVSFGALFFIIAGIALATPASTLVLLALLKPLIGRFFGSIGLMASRGVGNNLSRTAPAIAALVVAVSVTVGLGVMIDSFRGTLVRWLDGTLRADVYVSLPGPGASRASGTLWPELIDAFSTHPGVSGYSTYRGVDLVTSSDAFRLVALRLDPRGEGAFSFVDGDQTEIMAAFQAGEGVLISEPFAYRRALTNGDEVDLVTDSGAGSFQVLGVFYDYGSEQGTVMMARELFDRFYSDRGITSLGLFLDEQTDSEAVVSELIALVPQGRAVLVRTNDRLRAASLDVFDRTFRVTAVLRLLAFIVAFVGMLSALMALQLERAREIAVLRAIGLTPQEVRKLVVTQTGLMGLISGFQAIPMGLILSLVMIFVVNKRSFGWTLSMQVGPDVLVQAIALAVVAALLAGFYPAWIMARTSPVLALRGE